MKRLGMIVALPVAALACNPSSRGRNCLDLYETGSEYIYGYLDGNGVAIEKYTDSGKDGKLDEFKKGKVVIHIFDSVAASYGNVVGGDMVMMRGSPEAEKLQKQFDNLRRDNMCGE